MDEEGIGVVLARASELRSKFTNCIHKATTQGDEVEEGEEKEEGEAASETLLNIRDALESLESQLSSLQGLQQQQWYEREAALAEIDYSRQKLLKKLKQYKGEDLEVIHEASAFASETVEHGNDLLLPPYPSRPPRSLVADNGHMSHFPFMRKSNQNGVTAGDSTNEENKKLNESERNQMHSGSKNTSKGLGIFFNGAKMVLTLVGVISILSLAGVEPRFRKRDTYFNIMGLFQQSATEEKRSNTVECPPGKVLVLEDGEARCLVKERVEVPFESVVATPDVNYGCG